MKSVYEIGSVCVCGPLDTWIEFLIFFKLLYFALGYIDIEYFCKR